MIVGIQILLPELSEIVSMEGRHSTGHRDWPIGIGIGCHAIKDLVTKRPALRGGGSI